MLRHHLSSMAMAVKLWSEKLDTGIRRAAWTKLESPLKGTDGGELWDSSSAMPPRPPPEARRNGRCK